MTAYTTNSRTLPPTPRISARLVIEYTGSTDDSVTFMAARHRLATEEKR